MGVGTAAIGFPLKLDQPWMGFDGRRHRPDWMPMDATHHSCEVLHAMVIEKVDMFGRTSVQFAMI